jgi:flagellar biosynthesis protein FlhF
MRLKSFYAKTMTEAMQIVRDTLGEDAIIVATREENGGKSVRVTAAVEYEDERSQRHAGEERDERAMRRSQSAPSAGGEARRDINFELDAERRRRAGQSNVNPYNDYDDGFAEAIQDMAEGPKISDSWLQYDEEGEQDNMVVEYLTDTLLQHSVPGDVLDNIISTASMLGYDNPVEALSASFEHLYNFRPLLKKPIRKPLMLVGPPGAGKTLAVAKLAARYVMDGHKVGVITTDTVRAGGVEQLEAFTKLMKSELRRARDEKDLAVHIKELDQKVDQIIIDTGGSNPYDVDDMRALATMMNVASVEPILVMQAGIDAEECSEVARSYALLGVQRVMPTRLDITRRFGGLLSAAQKSGMAFADASNTHKVANGLFDFTPQSLAELFLPSRRMETQSRQGKTLNTAPNADNKRTKKTTTKENAG